MYMFLERIMIHFTSPLFTNPVLQVRVLQIRVLQVLVLQIQSTPVQSLVYKQCCLVRKQLYDTCHNLVTH